MTINGLMQLIHDAKALNEKWRTLTDEQKRELADAVMNAFDGVITVVELWAEMQRIAPDEEKATAVCFLCIKRRKVASRRILPGGGERVALCRKCSKRKF